MLELLISGQEGDVLDIAVVLDLAVNLIDEEGFDSIVELELPQVGANISHSEVRPVCVLNAMKEAIVLGNPEAVLEGVKVEGGVQGVS